MCFFLNEHFCAYTLKGKSNDTIIDIDINYINLCSELKMIWMFNIKLYIWWTEDKLCFLLVAMQLSKKEELN